MREGEERGAPGPAGVGGRKKTETESKIERGMKRVRNKGRDCIPETQRSRQRVTERQMETEREVERDRNRERQR